MPRLLVKYAKEGRLRFLSHLELIKSLERALRRADLPLSLTGGFHPKSKLSYGPALSLGASSTSEFLLVSLEEAIPLDSAELQISRTIPAGLRLVKAEYIPESAPSLGKIIKAASYVAFVSTGGQLTEEEVSSAIAWLFSQNELVVEKESGMKMVKRSEAVLDASASAVERGVEFELLLSIGTASSISPGSLVSIFLGGPFVDVDVTGMEIERTGLFALADGRPMDVFEYYKMLGA